MAYENVTNALTQKKAPTWSYDDPSSYAQPNLNPDMLKGMMTQWNAQTPGGRGFIDGYGLSRQMDRGPMGDAQDAAPQEVAGSGFISKPLNDGTDYYDTWGEDGIYQGRRRDESSTINFRNFLMAAAGAYGIGTYAAAANAAGAGAGAGAASSGAGLSGLDAALVDMGAGATNVGAGGAATGATGGLSTLGTKATGNGAWLGEGVASGIPSADAAAIKAAVGSGELGTAASYAGQTLQGGTALQTAGQIYNPATSAGSQAVQQATKSGGSNPGNPTGFGLKDAVPLVGAAATLASGGSVNTPQVPDYVKQAIATGNAGKYNEETPYGTITWSLRPGADPANPQPGDYIRSTNFSPEQQQLYEQNAQNQLTAGQVGGQQLADLGQGRQTVQDALYRRATQYYDQNFGDQENQLRTRLANQGLNEGSEAFERELRNFRQTKDSAYSDATDRAIAGADQQENNAVARIVNILNMSKATTPTSGNSAGGAGTDLLTAANQAYTANLGASNAQAAADAQQQNALLQLVLGGMKYYGG